MMTSNLQLQKHPKLPRNPKIFGQNITKVTSLRIFLATINLTKHMFVKIKKYKVYKILF